MDKKKAIEQKNRFPADDCLKKIHGTIRHIEIYAGMASSTPLTTDARATVPFINSYRRI